MVCLCWPLKSFPFPRPFHPLFRLSRCLGESVTVTGWDTAPDSDSNPGGAAIGTCVLPVAGATENTFAYEFFKMFFCTDLVYGSGRL